MKTDFPTETFSDECKATLEGLIGWTTDWLFIELVNYLDLEDSSG